jgi:hypothetical protein
MYKKLVALGFAVSVSENLEMKSLSTQLSAAFAAIFLVAFASGLEFKECRNFLGRSNLMGYIIYFEHFF